MQSGDNDEDPMCNSYTIPEVTGVEKSVGYNVIQLCKQMAVTDLL